jgi:ElaB/YqjD/DUF883 family membrane-anchored ribosome-binding protein
MPTLTMAEAAPIGTRAVLVGAMIVGTLLMLWGARLLRPAVVLATMAACFLFAVVAARNALPQVPLWAAAAVGAVAGLLAGALLYRPAVAAATAVVAATAGALIAFAVMAGGSLDTAPRDLGHALVANPREVSRPGDGSRAGMRMLEVLSPPAGMADDLGAGAQSVVDASAPMAERALRSTADAARRGWNRGCQAVEATDPPFRTLLVGSTAAGAVSGLLLGLLFTTLMARVLTSLAGAWLLVAGALPLLASHGHAPMPDDPRAWLVVLTALTVAGTLMQSALGGAPASKSRATRAASKAAKAAPKASATAANDAPAPARA